MITRIIRTVFTIVMIPMIVITTIIERSQSKMIMVEISIKIVMTISV